MSNRSSLATSDALIDPYDSFPRRLPRQITELYFGHHQPPISALHPHFSTFVNAEVIWLNHNCLSSFDALSSLPRLRELYLHNNKITLIPPSFTSVRFIRVLVLHSNKLRNLDKVLRQLKHLSPTLEQLDLWGNPLSEEVDYRERVLSVFQNLKVFDRLVVNQGAIDGSDERGDANTQPTHVAFGTIYRGPRVAGVEEEEEDLDVGLQRCVSVSSALALTARSDAARRQFGRRTARRKKITHRDWTVHYDDPHQSHRSTQAFGAPLHLADAVQKVREYRHRCKIENRRPYQVGQEDEPDRFDRSRRKQQQLEREREREGEHSISESESRLVRNQNLRLRWFARETLAPELRKTDLNPEQLGWILGIAGASRLPSSRASESSSNIALVRSLFPFLQLATVGEEDRDVDFGRVFLSLCDHYGEVHHARTKQLDAELLEVKRKLKKNEGIETPMERYRRKKALRLARESGDAETESQSGSPDKTESRPSRRTNRRKPSSRKAANRSRRGTRSDAEVPAKDEDALLEERKQTLHSESLAQGVMASRWDSLKRDFEIQLHRLERRHRVISSKHQKRARGDFYQIGGHYVQI